MFHLDTPLGKVNLIADGVTVVPDCIWDAGKRFDADHSLEMHHALP